MKDPCVTQAQKESETPTSKLEIPETLKSLENIERTEIAIKKELKKRKTFSFAKRYARKTVWNSLNNKSVVDIGKEPILNNLAANLIVKENVESSSKQSSNWKLLSIISC